jgi:signal transduction histidine kinase
MKLHPRVFSLVIGVLIISVLAMAIPVYWYTRSALEDEFDHQLLNYAKLVSHVIPKNLLVSLAREPALGSVRQSVEVELALLVSEGIAGLAVYSGAGQELAKWEDSLTSPPDPLLSAVISELSDTNLAVVSEIYQLSDRNYFKAAATAINIQTDHQLAIVVWGGAQFMSSLDQLTGSLFWIILFALLASVSLAIFFSRSLVKPVIQLATYTNSIKNNIYSERLEYSRTDEFGQLNRALNEMHREIQQNEQSLKTLLSGIAHEIKNPLGGMEIYTGLLKQSLESGDAYNPQESISYLEKVVMELGRLKQIVLEYLDYARPQRAQPKTLAIERVLDDVKRLLQPVINHKKIDFTIIGQGVLISDESKMRRVLLNLLENSLDAVPAGGKIQVDINNSGDNLNIVVTDTGAGIDSNDIEHIFEPHFTTKNKGYGLGLSIVKNIIDELNGTIIVSSDIGKGSKFTLRLPGQTT